MHLRRALLLMGLVLLVVAGVESLVQVPRDQGALPRPAAPTAPVVASPVRAIAFRYPGERRVRSVTMALGAHATVRVDSARPGQVTLVGLGRVLPVEPGTPASFDVLAASAGTYDVVFEPVSGPGVRIGRLAIR